MHTPGPWKWWTSNGLNRLTAERGRDGGVLSAVHLRDGFADIEVSQADARLIAAAPDLLDVAKMLVACAAQADDGDEYIDVGLESPLMHAAWEAIASAEGWLHG